MGSLRVVAGPDGFLGTTLNAGSESSVPGVCRLNHHLGVSHEGDTGLTPFEFMRFGILVVRKFGESIHN